MCFPIKQFPGSVIADLLNGCLTIIRELDGKVLWHPLAKVPSLLEAQQGSRSHQRTSSLFPQESRSTEAALQRGGCSANENSSMQRLTAQVGRLIAEATALEEDRAMLEAQVDDLQADRCAC
jgi:hypothetical protein